MREDRAEFGPPEALPAGTAANRQRLPCAAGRTRVSGHVGPTAAWSAAGHAEFGENVAIVGGVRGCAGVDFARAALRHDAGQRGPHRLGGDTGSGRRPVAGHPSVLFLMRGRVVVGKAVGDDGSGALVTVQVDAGGAVRSVRPGRGLRDDGGGDRGAPSCPTRRDGGEDTQCSQDGDRRPPSPTRTAAPKLLHNGSDCSGGRPRRPVRTLKVRCAFPERSCRGRSNAGGRRPNAGHLRLQRRRNRRNRLRERDLGLGGRGAEGWRPRAADR